PRPESSFPSPAARGSLLRQQRIRRARQHPGDHHVEQGWEFVHRDVRNHPVRHELQHHPAGRHPHKGRREGNAQDHQFTRHVLIETLRKGAARQGAALFHALTSRTRAKLRLPTCSTPSKPAVKTRCASSTTCASMRTARSFNLRLASELLAVRPAAVNSAGRRRPSAETTMSLSGTDDVSPSPRTTACQPAIAFSASASPWKRAASSRARRNLASRGFNAPLATSRLIVASSSSDTSKLNNSNQRHIKSSPIFRVLVTKSIAGSSMPM